jgi:hypothetical protein
MNSLSPDEQKERMAAFLAHQRTGILSISASQSVWALPVCYRTISEPAGMHSLEMDCLVPRWADMAHYLTQDSKVLLIVQAFSGIGLHWLQILGTVRPVQAPEWSRLLPRWVSSLQPDRLYLVVRVRPSRIDLVDEELGWGVQETLEW